MRTIALINPKGGSGKTTTAVALADALARHHGRTLLVDLDPGACATAALAVRDDAIDRHIGDALQAPALHPDHITELVWPVRTGLALVPARHALTRTEAGGSALSLAPDRDDRLTRVLRTLATIDGREHRFAVVDTGPALSVLAFNAVRAADAVLIPADVGSPACVASIERTLAALDAIHAHGGHNASVRIVPVRTTGRAHAVGTLDTIERRWGSYLLGEGGDRVELPDDPAFAEAAALGRLPGEHAAGRPGVAGGERLASVLVGLLGSRGASAAEGKPGVGALSIPKAGGIETLFDGSVSGGGGDAGARLEVKPSGDEGAPEPIRFERAGDDSDAAGDGVNARAAELVARTRALSARLARNEAKRRADAGLEDAVRRAESSGPLRRRA